MCSPCFWTVARKRTTPLEHQLESQLATSINQLSLRATLPMQQSRAGCLGPPDTSSLAQFSAFLPFNRQRNVKAQNPVLRLMSPLPTVLLFRLIHHWEITGPEVTKDEVWRLCSLCSPLPPAGGSFLPLQFPRCSNSAASLNFPWVPSCLHTLFLGLDSLFPFLRRTPVIRTGPP